jgi:hypothetical protein
MMRFTTLLTLLGLPAIGWPADLGTNDGLALRLDDRGAVIGVRLGGVDQPLTGPGGFFVADVAGVPTRDVELLASPGFEEKEDGRPLGWSVGQGWTVSVDAPHSGKTCMRVSVPGPEPGRSGGLSATVPVKPNCLYRVSMWQRTKGCAPAMYIVQLDAEGNARTGYPQTCISHARKDSDWFQLTHCFVTAPFCRSLTVYTNIWEQAGEAWADDFSVTAQADDFVTPQTACPGSVQAADDGLHQTCTLADRGLTLEATYRSLSDRIEVAGIVADTTGRDRAVTVSFRLPLEATGRTWFDDLRNSQPIEPGVTYGSARFFGDRRTLALFPFATMGNDKGALALAVPMDMPRVFRLCYERGKGFFVNYEFGLSQDAAKMPGRADFRLVLYRLDPQWGFRAAAQRYYEAFPQFFVKRMERPGPAGFMDAPDKVDAPGYVMPAAAIWDYHKREGRPAYDRAGVRLFSYTECAGWWGWAIGISPDLAKVKPTPEAAWAHVEELAHANPPNDVAQCILNCAPQDRDGRPVLSDNYVAEWGGYNYTCNPDPEITGLGDVNRYKLTLSREVSQIKSFSLDGLYLDCVFVSTTDNFRRAHFRTADNPLAFDHESKRPVMPLAFSVYECVKALCDQVHAEGKTVLSNYGVTGGATDMSCIEFIDLIGNEMLWTWTSDPQFSLQRVLAYQKPVSMSWQEAKTTWEEARIEREVKQAMFYGTYYHLSNLSAAIRDRWAPLTDRLATAGWEPITDATVDPPLMVERFGRAKDGNLHFTLRNETEESRTAQLLLDARALGLAGEGVWLAKDATAEEPQAVEKAEGEWTTTVTVPAGDTVVVRVGE